MANIVNGYETVLAIGTYRMAWGDPDIMQNTPDLVMVLPTDDPSMLLLVDIDSETLQPTGSMKWPSGPDECLTDPLRVLRDSEKGTEEDPEPCKWVRKYSDGVWSG